MAKQKSFQLSDLKPKLRYKFIGKNPLATPYGLIDNKHPHSYTGEEWKAILVYDFSPNSTPPFNKMFKQVKDNGRKSRTGNLRKKKK